MALFEITDDIRATYQDGIDTMIDQLGKDCQIACPGDEAPCPNCVWDAVARASAGVYNGTGPREFFGPPCPVCKGSGLDPATALVLVVKRFLIKRNIRPSLVLPPGSLSRPVEIVRIKGYAADAAPLVGMKYIRLDYRNQTIVAERFIKLTEPAYSGSIVAGRYFQMYVQRAD